MKKLLISLNILITLFTSLSLTFAQTKLPLKIDNVMRNNELINIYEGDIIYGLEGDAIRIAGVGAAGDTVNAMIAGKEYSTTVNKFGDWFLLFSITDFSEETYIIQITNLSGENDNITLKIDEGPGITLDENTPKSSSTLLIILISAFSFIALLTLIIVFRKKISKLFIKSSKLPK